MFFLLRFQNDGNFYKTEIVSSNCSKIENRNHHTCDSTRYDPISKCTIDKFLHHAKFILYTENEYETSWQIKHQYDENTRHGRRQN